MNRTRRASLTILAIILAIIVIQWVCDRVPLLPLLVVVPMVAAMFAWDFYGRARK